MFAVRLRGHWRQVKYDWKDRCVFSSFSFSSSLSATLRNRYTPTHTCVNGIRCDASPDYIIAHRLISNRNKHCVAWMIRWNSLRGKLKRGLRESPTSVHMRSGSNVYNCQRTNVFVSNGISYRALQSNPHVKKRSSGNIEQSQRLYSSYTHTHESDQYNGKDSEE